MNNEGQAIVGNFLMELFQEMRTLLDHTDVLTRSAHYLESLRVVMDEAWNAVHVLVSPYPEVNPEAVPQADNSFVLATLSGRGSAPLAPQRAMSVARGRNYMSDSPPSYEEAMGLAPRDLSSTAFVPIESVGYESDSIEVLDTNSVN